MGCIALVWCVLVLCCGLAVVVWYLCAVVTYKGLVPYKWISSNMWTYTYQQLWVRIWIVVSNVAHIVWMGECYSKRCSKVRAWFSGRQVLVAVPIVADVGSDTYPPWTSQNSLADGVHKWLHTWTAQKQHFMGIKVRSNRTVWWRKRCRSSGIGQHGAG